MDDGLKYLAQPLCSRLDSVGVDFLTCTQERGDHGSRLEAVGLRLIDAEHDRGCEVKEGKWKGYRVTRSGSAMVGERGDGIIVQASGHLAADYWRVIVPLARKVSRLDLQVTGTYSEPEPDLARTAFNTVPALPYDRGRPRTVLLVASTRGGDSLYFGSRASDVFGRHYDKGLEQGTAAIGRQWRWEIEFKRAFAWDQALSLTDQRDPSTYIADQVFSWFWRWGLKPGFRRPSSRRVGRLLEWLTSSDR